MTSTNKKQTANKVNKNNANAKKKQNNKTNKPGAILCQASALKLKTSVKKMALCLRYMKYKLGFAKFCQINYNKKFKNVQFDDFLQSLNHLANIKKTAKLFLTLLKNLENNMAHKLCIEPEEIKWDKYQLMIAIGSGSYYRRFRPRARGRTYHIKKKLTNVLIKVVEV